MALNSDLLVSWNFDTVTGSVDGTFIVDDTSNEYSGKGIGVNTSSNFVLKEEIKTGKKRTYETLDGIDTIQLVEADDERTSAIKKPSSVRLMVENSMYQIISDEMYNLFSTVDSYAFKFTTPENKYKSEYTRLNSIRTGFFENVQENPNLEKYIEFYKWIDSSLGSLIDQLKPENASDFSGLKTTVESHILERNKFQHKLPLTVKKNPVYNQSSPITVIKAQTGSANSHSDLFATGNIPDVVSVENISNKNYSSANQYFQTAGRYINNRGNKINKTVLQTRFSAGGGESETVRDSSGEFSIYNTLNLKSLTQKADYNLSQSFPAGRQWLREGLFIKQDSTIDLLHFENNLSNAGNSGATWSIVGSATFDTTNKKFGSNSLLIQNSFTNGIRTNGRTLNNFNSTSGNFTIEFWHKPNVINVGKLIFSIDDGTTNNGIFICTNTSNNLIANVMVGGSLTHVIVLTSFLANTNDWYHIALSRQNNVIKLFGNGQVHNVNTCIGANLGTPTTMRFGAAPNVVFGASSLNGYIDEFRASDVCLYTNNFTPPDRLNSSILGSNQFIQRAIPYTASSYHQTGSIGYQVTPNEETEFRQRNSILIDDIDNEFDVIEPPIQFGVPAKHTLRVNGAFEDIEVYSPYNTKFDTFSPRTLERTGSGVSLRAYFDKEIDKFSDKDTFHKKIIATTPEQLVVKRYELLDYIFPRKDLMGRDEIRSKPNYEEVSGSFSTTALTWSQNSYNNNSAKIRTFWKDNAEDRKRTKGANVQSGTGSINVLNSYNLSQSFSLNVAKTGALAVGSGYYVRHTASVYFNSYDSKYCFDSRNSSISTFDYNGETYASRYYFGNPTYDLIGELAPTQPNEKIKFLLSGSSIPSPRARPQFVNNNFLGILANVSEIADPTFEDIRLYFYENYSYINFTNNYIDVTQFRPFYNSFEEYFENIKNKSHDMSIISEFCVSNFKSIINSDFDSYKNDYLTNDGNDKFYLNTNTIGDFNTFVDKKTNKIKLSFKGIKKLRPYNGFYPAHRSLQIINNFIESYSGSLTEQEKQALIQPFFGPGILFNTIKSGIAVDSPIILSSSSNTTFSEIYLPAFHSVYEVDPLEYVSGHADSTLGSVYKDYNRLPFEALLDPKILFNEQSSSKHLFYLDGTYYSKIFTANSSSNLQFPSISIQKLTSSNDYQYRLSINNFLSEIPNFFLKDNNLTKFSSADETIIKGGFEKNKTYKMRIKIKKTDNFSFFQKDSGSLKEKNNYFNLNLPPESLFGVPTAGLPASIVSTVFFNPFLEETYYPFTPPYLRTPYYLNQSDVVLSYTHTKEPSDTNFSLKTIINSLTASSQITGSSAKYAKHAMTLASCINYNNLEPVSEITIDAITGEPITTTKKDSYRWIIQTKFETPSINITSSADTFVDETTQPLSSVNSIGFDSGKFFKGFYTRIKNNGLWSVYGRPPEEDEGIILSIDDNGFDNSLLEAVGFIKNDQRKIGVLADNKQISEAVVMIPFTEASEDNVLLTKNIENNIRFFKIKEDVINKLLGIPSYKKIISDPTKGIRTIKTILESKKDINQQNSIIQLMLKMVNYNIPPHLNWLFDASIEPFVMYITEFTHNLNKIELSNVWQNTMPEIATTPEEQTVNLEHNLSTSELFENYDFLKFKPKFKIFKIKKRANTDYYSLTANPDDFNKGLTIPWYSYNWPYDYFSLVELVNVKAGGVYEQPTFNVTPLEDRLIPAGTINGEQLFYNPNSPRLTGSIG
jgi:hypothetical protein